MSSIARLAIGSVRDGLQRADEPPSTRYVTWALAELLARSSFTAQRRQVQLFRGDDRPCCDRAARAAVGLQSRQLDSWSMSAETCRLLFGLGCRGREFALVEGTYGADEESPSDLSRLADWLNLPRVVVIDSRRLSPCRIPPRPATVDAVILDQVADRRTFCALATTLEAQWGTTVIGGMEAAPRVREALARSTPGSQAWREALQTLAGLLHQLTSPAALEQLATSGAPLEESWSTVQEALPPLRLAVAWDDAFPGPSPDFVELMEDRGAELRDFSPLRDEALPGECDLVYLGPGRVAERADQLAANACMLMALRRHAWNGRRVLAEADGLAYACSNLLDSRGCHHTLAGLLPCTARWQRAQKAAPIETCLATDCWLAPAGTWLRGYRCGQWSLDHEPTARGLLQNPRELLVARRTIGTQLRIHYAARPDLMRALFAPRVGAAVGLGAV